MCLCVHAELGAIACFLVNCDLGGSTWIENRNFPFDFDMILRHEEATSNNAINHESVFTHPLHEIGIHCPASPLLLV
jgi:hypothetical protein